MAGGNSFSRGLSPRKLFSAETAQGLTPFAEEL
jgi:hypothetical protein